MIRLERLREVLHYDPATGRFTWQIATSRRVSVGDEAGSIADGYISICVDRRHYRAHVLAWFYMTGRWPTGDVDHENLVRDDNRWVNLREATRSNNMGNTRRHSDNKSGFKGVHWEEKTKRWCAQILCDGKKFWLGRHSTPEAAHQAYSAKAAELFGEFANDGAAQ